MQYYLTAYARMGNDLRAIADADYIWQSLNCLWEEVRLTGQGEPVATPILGSDLARTGLPRMALVKLIIISFIVASKKQYVTKKLTLVMYLIEKSGTRPPRGPRGRGPQPRVG